MVWPGGCDRLNKDSCGRLKVGICWRSSLRTTRRSQQYADIASLAQILQVPGVQFFNLQYDECADELFRLNEESGASILDFPEVDMLNDIDEVSALVSHLVLVISAQTAVVAIAAGVGVKTWNFLSDGSWPLLGTSRQPFLPAVEKIYLRKWNESWRPHFTRLADDLSALVRARSEKNLSGK